MTPQHFKQLRKASKLTQTQMAHELGISLREVIRYEMHQIRIPTIVERYLFQRYGSPWNRPQITS